MRWISLLLLLSSAAFALPDSIHQEGFLTDAQGRPHEGPVQLRFSLYDQAEGGAALWFEEHALNLTTGYYSVILGEQSPFGPALDADPRFMEVSVDGVDLLPRVRLSSVPYARRAEDAVGDIHPRSLSVGGQQIIDEGGNWVGPAVPGVNDGVGYDTPAEILAAVKTVDGAGAGLDVDLLDGLSSAAFVQGGDQVMALVLERDEAGSGLDVDRLDGEDSSAFLRTAEQLITLLLTTDGSGTGLDADLLDGQESAQFLRATDPLIATQLLNLLLSVDGANSSLDVDLLDGLNTDAFMRVAAPGMAVQLLNLLIDIDGADSGLDADHLDGLHASKFMRRDLNTGTSGDLSVGGALSADGALITGTFVAQHVEADLIQTEVLQFIPLEAPPEAPSEGTLYFNGQLQELRIFNGTMWTPIGGFQSNLFGDGSDGDVDIDAANTVVNAYAMINANANAQDMSVTVNDASLFSVGDEVLVIQMQEGDGAAYTAGTYEFKNIVGINGNTVTFASSLINDYGFLNPNTNSSIVAQIVKVPQFNNININANCSIVPQAWDGEKGGVVVFRVRGTLNMTGSVDASQRGFRGGDWGQGNNDPGQTGESISGKGNYAGSSFPQNPSPNNGGGAGGPGASLGGCGAGGGGYGTAGGSGTRNNAVDALGGVAYGDPELSRIYLGSAGGGGGDNDGHGACGDGYHGEGGAGGGIVFITANSIQNARIYSNGEPGHPGDCGGGGCGYAIGASGAGGSIYLMASSISSSEIHANGGPLIENGSDCNGATPHNDPTGGTGGVGRIRIDVNLFSGPDSAPASHRAALPE